ncbi:MAG: hypothetical protein AB7H97_14550 [Pseudobdellovibrionaceae bacterium]
MSDDFEKDIGVSMSMIEQGAIIKITFKPKEPGKILSTEESQLLRAYIGEILEEIEIEEKKIIEEERLAALEVTARKDKKEG